MSGRTRTSKAKDGVRFEWERAVRVLDLPSTTKLVALTLATYCDGETGRNAHPGEDRLAADCSLSTRAVRSHLTRLRDVGLIERSRRGSANQHRRVADEYTLRLPENLLDRVAILHDHPSLGARRDRNDASGTEPVVNESLPEALFRQQPVDNAAATGT